MDGGTSATGRIGFELPMWGLETNELGLFGKVIDILVLLGVVSKAGKGTTLNDCMV